MFTLKPIIDPARAERVFDDALQLLAQIGLACPDDAVAKQLGKRVRLQYTDGRLRFDRNDLFRHFEKRKASLIGTARPDTLSTGGQWHAWYYLDPLNNQPREATYDEAVDMAHLAEALGKEGGPIPVAPGGIPPRRHTLECERLALLHTKKLGGGLTATDTSEINTLLELYAIAGRRYTLAIEPLISPLRVNVESMGLFFQWADDPRLNIDIYETIPMAGATAPLIFPAALSSAFAETLAQDYLIHTYSEGRHNSGFSVRLEAIDMRSMNIMLGAPESYLFRQSIMELYKALTTAAPIGGVLHSNSRRVDAQALIERTTGLLWQVSCGARVFSGIGQLSVDELFSPVMAVIDREIMKTAERLMRSLDAVWDDTADTVDIVREGVENQSYLDLDSTVRLFRECFDFDILSSYESYSSWMAGGGKSMEEKAWDKAASLIAANTFSLDAEKAREINKIVDNTVL